MFFYYGQCTIMQVTDNSKAQKTKLSKLKQVHHRINCILFQENTGSKAQSLNAPNPLLR